jgi:large subunit ribosomal protein L13
MAEYHIDAKNKKLGRMAAEIAGILQGKKSPAYDPAKVGEDKAIVSNVKDLEISGNKAEQKIYYRHTGYVGHLKETKYKDAFAKNPKEVVREAVRRMLPKNFLNARRLKNLIFVENNGD